jgi:hypothetical protein
MLAAEETSMPTFEVEMRVHTVAKYMVVADTREEAEQRARIKHMTDPNSITCSSYVTEVNTSMSAEVIPNDNFLHQRSSC